MAVVQNIFEKYATSINHGLLNLPSDTYHGILFPSTASINLATAQFYSDVSSQEYGTAGGYTAGGVALSAPSLTLTTASAWTQNWAAGLWTPGQIITNGTSLQVCVNGGTSSGSTPTFSNTPGVMTTDSGSVEWTCIGAWADVFTSTAVTFATLTTASMSPATAIGYFAIMKYTGTPSTSPLMVLQTYSGGDILAPSGQNYVVTPLTPEGWLQTTPG